MQKTHFSSSMLWRPLLNEKQKRPFVSLKDEVTIIHGMAWCKRDVSDFFG